MSQHQLHRYLLEHRRAKSIYEALGCAEPELYRSLAALVADLAISSHAQIVGIGGGQGSGKSTLANLLKQAFAVAGEVSETICLDDFYRTGAERRELGRSTHPLLRTRGVPGTHDMELLDHCMQRILEGHESRLPRFDKGHDDRVGWIDINNAPNRLVLEGWCVGARPEPRSRLLDPCNSLEKDRDPKGAWRKWVNQDLAGLYQTVFNRIELLVFLRVPDLATVRTWRSCQELEQPVGRRMNAQQIDVFVSHFERLTLWMLEDLPARAEVVVDLGRTHEVVALHIGGKINPDGST